MVLLTERTLGRLARWLRLLGYDAPLLERPPVRVPPGAVLLTRRASLAGRPGVLLIKSDHLREQLPQVVKELGLALDPARLLSRCLDCNLPIEPITREQAAGLVPDYTLAIAPCFTRCPGCGKVFWPGSHGQRALRQIQEMLGKASA
jgi:uncharacterized protein with PIN domain